MITTQKLDIMALNAELMRQRESRKDLVVDTRLLQATVGDDSKDPEQKVIKLDIQAIDKDGNKYTQESYPLNEWAHKQLATKCGIPQKYYDKCNTPEHLPLLQSNINEWISDKDRRMLRILDGNIRAIQSDRYKCLDNYELLGLALEQFKKHGAEIHRCDLSETHMFIKAIIPEMSIDVNTYKKSQRYLEIKNGMYKNGHKWLPITDKNADILQAGLLLKNSEVGASRFVVEPFVLRVMCNNGLIGDHSLAKVHLGARHELGEIDFSDRTKALEDEVTWSQAKDVIEAVFNKDIFENWINNHVLEKTEAPIENPVEAIGAIVTTYKMEEWTREELLNSMIKSQMNTQWGLINAVTETAKKCDYYEGQLELEKIGGKLTAMSVTQLGHMIGQ